MNARNLSKVVAKHNQIAIKNYERKLHKMSQIELSWAENEVRWKHSNKSLIVHNPILQFEKKYKNKNYEKKKTEED